MTTPSETALTKTSSKTIDYDLFLDCVHCGLCSATCPTYAELGNENDSPRGRIYLMRAVTDRRIELNQDVRRHLELCLDCRACETACPSGVQYGKLIEPFRIEMQKGSEGDDGGAKTAENTIEDAKTNDWFHRHLLFGLFPYPKKMRKTLRGARIVQKLRIDRVMLATGVWKLLPQRLGRMATLLPTLQKPGPEFPKILPAKGRRRARVALFTGCVGDAMFRHTHWATARVLQENGCDVVVPKNQVCCGAIHYHGGSESPAKKFADENIAAFSPNDVDAIIVNVAGCGSMLKEYSDHWDDQHNETRRAFSSKVRDVNEFLGDLGLVAPPGKLPITVTYHDACHLAHAQQVRSQPRELLQSIPGLTLNELPEAELCCGAAGTYNLTEPEMADRLAKRKLANIRKTGANIVVTANAGCLMQIAREARLSGDQLHLVHPMELLDFSYRKKPFPG